jgi:amino-acid N-acetyltransferase
VIGSLREDAFIEPGAPETPLLVRKAAMRDIRPILDLINGYAAQGIMLPRTEFELSEAIRDFSVIVRQGRLLGCGALHFYTPTLGEIRSLAVHPEAKTKGVGRKLVASLVSEAQEHELDAVFAFTYAPQFFRKTGFHEVDRGILPLKAWKDCVRCPKFQSCDEIAVLRVLRPEHWLEAPPEQWAAPSPDDALIRIPTPAAGGR